MPKALRALAFLLLVVVLLTPLGCRRGARPAPPTPAQEGVQSPSSPGGQAPAGAAESGAAKPLAPGSSAPTPPVKPTAAGEVKEAGAERATPSDAPPTAEPARPARPPAGTVALWITRDFGGGLLKNPNVKPVADEKILALLGRQTQLETAYGGGFVTRIDGLGSGRPGEDWFYWVNGILAGIGAGEFPARPGDIVWWDFHPWNRTAFLPAVVGAYPEPFVRGYTGKAAAARVIYSAEAAEEVQAVARALAAAGAPKPELLAYGRASLLKRSAPTLLVATWPEVKDDEELAGLLKNWRRTGLYLTFSGAELVPLRADGKADSRCGAGSGVIAATGSGPGDVSPLWLILGTDAVGLERAVTVLTQRPQELTRRVGVVVDSSGKILSLPVVEGS